MTKFKPANVLLEKHMNELGLEFVKEYRFHETRRWRFDYLLCTTPENFTSLAVEIEGGIFTNGRHTRGKGFEADCIKYSTAAMMGYRVLRFSTNQILRGTARAFLKEWLCGD